MQYHSSNEDKEGSKMDNNEKISWIFDEEGNIITSRVVHFIDEAKRDFSENAFLRNLDKSDQLRMWKEFYGQSLLDIIDEVCKNPEKVK